jgi:hypothetical protein
VLLPSIEMKVDLGRKVLLVAVAVPANNLGVGFKFGRDQISGGMNS